MKTVVIITIMLTLMMISMMIVTMITNIKIIISKIQTIIKK